MAKQAEITGVGVLGGAAADAAAGARLDPSTWAARLGRGRKGLALALAQGGGDLALFAGAVMVAYLMLASWPASLQPVEKALHQWPVLLARTARSPEFAPFLPLLVIIPVVRVLALQWVGAYAVNLADTRPFHGVPRILQGALLASLFLAAVASVYPAASAPGTPSLALFLVYEGLLALLFTLLFHSGTLIAVLVLHAFGLGRTRVAVIHDGSPPPGLLRALRSPATEYALQGEIVVGGDPPPGALGTLEELPALINRHSLDEVILAVDPGSLPPEQRLNVAQTCWRLGLRIKMCSPFQPFFRTRAHPEIIGETPLLLVENIGLYATLPQAAKRVMDFTVAAAALVCLSPLLLVTALLIRLDSPGPVFFIQERVGLNGRVFRMIKFRSMRTGADPKIHQEYLQKMIQNGEHSEVGADGKPVYKIVNDPRITRLGRFIRKTSIDELPQFINVLRGDMSLVGPRPPIQYEVDAYKDWHMKRLYIRPGITGLWQVSGRNRLSFDQMVRLDIAYIEQWSLWLDVKIMVKTVPVLLHLDQAY